MIWVKVLVSRREREELGTSGRGRNWDSDVMWRKRKESGSGRSVEWYEGDEARQFGTRVQRAAKL